jgi:hypothetical protein
MPRFANREEYEAWKAGQAAGGAAAAAPAASAPVASTPMRAVPQPASGPPVMAAAAVATPPAAKPKQGFKETFSGLPPWAWPFIVASFAIPVISLGGAIPGALGFGAAAGCASVAKKPDWETLPRVVVCALIAGGAWVLFLAFAAAIASRR